MDLPKRKRSMTMHNRTILRGLLKMSVGQNPMEELDRRAPVIIKGVGS